MLLQKISQTDTHILFVGAEARGCSPVITGRESAGVTGELWASESVAGEPTPASPVVTEGLLGGLSVDVHRSQLYHLSEIMLCLSTQAQEKNQWSGREPGWIQKASPFNKHLGGLPWWSSG